MTWKDHFIQRRDLYVVFLIWAGAGSFLPVPAAIGIAVLSFFLILRTGDLTNILIALIGMLIISDSRSRMFAFAETAKIGVVVLVLLYIVFNYSQLHVRDNPVFKYFLPYLLFAVLATSWSAETFTAFQKSLSYSIVFFIVPLLYLNGTKENENIGVELVFFFLSVLAIGLIINVFNPAFTTLVGRYRGLFGNPNGLGIFVIVVFAVFYPHSRRYPEQLATTRFRIFFYGALILSLVLSGSRTALFAIGIFFMFNRLRYLSNGFALLVFVVLVTSYEYLLLQLPVVVQFLGLEEYFRIQTLEEGSGRFVAWGFAWKQIQEVFFFGGGFTYNEYVFRMFGDELSMLGHQGNVHNSYLTIWLDTGLIGLVLFSIGLIRSTAAALQKSPYTLPILFAVLFSTYFESWLSASLNPFTSLFILALTILSQDEVIPDLANEVNHPV